MHRPRLRWYRYHMKMPQHTQTATTSFTSPAAGVISPRQARGMLVSAAARGGALLLIGVVGLVSSGCDSKGPPPMPAPRAVTPAMTPTQPSVAPGTSGVTRPATPPGGGGAGSGGSAVTAGQFSVGGLLLTIPEGWKPSVPASSPFAPIADLRFAHEAGEARAAFFAVEGGGVTMNIERWRRQVKLPEGIDAQMTTAERNGMKMTRIDMTGEYAGMTPAGQAAPLQTNTRFVGIVIEGGPRPVQVRLTGPKAAVDSALASFDQMLAGMTKP